MYLVAWLKQWLPAALTDWMVVFMARSKWDSVALGVHITSILHFFPTCPHIQSSRFPIHVYFGVMSNNILNASHVIFLLLIARFASNFLFTVKRRIPWLIRYYQSSVHVYALMDP